MTVETIDDHRPEKATREAEQHAVDEHVAEERRAPYQVAHGKTTRHQSCQRKVQRPAWLLRQPRSLVLLQGEPTHRGPLRLMAGPERIETGWWDGAPARRDYYVMANREGETLWVFQDLVRGGWFLHGFFA